LVFDDHVSVVDRHSVRTWGADKGGSVVVFRSALCSLDDDRLMYVAAGDVDISDFADILVNAGCATAMQLDVNGPGRNSPCISASERVNVAGCSSTSV